jgi:hypothetical protein
MIKTRPQKTKTTSQLMKELDTVFSEFIRLRDCDHQGTVKCFVTGDKIWWKEADAAHWRPRQHMGTRWDERNVHACTPDSNRFDPNHLTDYDMAMIRNYSIETMSEIMDASKSIMKWTAAELSGKN